MYVTFKKAGRLGNNLFQTANIISYANKYNLNIYLPWFKYAEHFSIPEYFFEKPNKNLTNFNFHEKENNKPIPPPEVITNHNKNDSIINFIGYYHNALYFEKKKEIVKDMLSPRERIFITKKDVCGVHVRRGDYLHKRFVNNIGVLPKDYYISAIEEVQAKKYLFFSDDLPWCKKNFSHIENCEFAKPSSAIDHFWELSQCEHQILANSTFSWWAAYLKQSKSKQIITPKIWWKKRRRNYMNNIVNWKEIESFK